MKPDPNTRGFTLAEVVIVLCILAVTSALAVPKIEPLLRRQELKSAVRALAAAAAEARERAMLDGEPWGLALDLDDGLYWTARLGELGMTRTAKELASEGKAKSLPEDVRVKRLEKRDADPVETGRAVIGFLPMGLSEPCVLTIAADGQERLLALVACSGRLTPVENEKEAAFLLGFARETPAREKELAP